MPTVEWSDIESVFCEKGGPIPDIDLNARSSTDVLTVYRLVQKRMGDIPRDKQFRPIHTADGEKTFSLNDDMEDVIGEINPTYVYVVFEDLQSNSGHCIPDLGVEIAFPDLIGFDYKCGPHWTVDSFHALLELLDEVYELTGCEFTFLNDDGKTPRPNGDLVIKYWRDWRAVRLTT